MGVARGRCWAAGVVAGVLACVLAVAPSASADVPSVPASGGASQCVPDKSTIAQCFPDKALAQNIAKDLKGDAGKTGEVLTSQDVNNTTDLSVNDSSVASVQGLQVFTNLKKLDLSGTQVSDVSPLVKLPKLNTLFLLGTQVSDVTLSSVAKLAKLTSLDLSDTQVSNVSSLEKLTNLGGLGLSYTQVSDVSPLAKLAKLTLLDLSNTRVSDVSALAKLTDLVGLNLNDTQVSDVSPLAELTSLWDLDLSGTRVSDVSPLAGLTNLIRLSLSDTQVSDVSALAKLTDLHELNLSGAGVLDLGVLQGLPLFGGCNASGVCATSFAGVRPSARLTVDGDGSVSMPAPRWLDGTVVAPSSTSPAGGTLDAKRGVVVWKTYDPKASYSYDFKQSLTLNYGDSVEFSGHVTGVKPVAKMFAVSFDSAGGSSVVSQTVEYGARAVAPKDPVRAGYAFQGWYTAKSGGSKYDFDKPVTGGLTLYARWKANAYTLSFDANGGSVSPGSRSVTYGSAYGQLPTPSRKGYTFQGWYTARSGGSKIGANTVAAGSATVYAHWTANSYRVTFDADGGSVQTAGKTVTQDQPYGTLPTPARAGHTFSGWYTAKSGGSRVTASTVFTAGAAQTLFAHWDAVVFTVSFDSAGGSSVASQTVEYGTKVSVPKDPVRAGYAFQGWYTARTGGSRYDFGKPVTGGLTLYARWTPVPKTFTVSFDSAGGSSVASQSVVSGGGVVKPVDPSRSGYVFVGWYTKDGKAFDFNSVVKSDVALVARWKPVAASVVFRDVSSSTPHASDIAWLADAGVSTGWREPDGSYSFRGMDSVKRQDMAAFLYREASRRGAAGVPAGAGYARFRDVTGQTPHAQEIGWLADAGVSTGWREADGSYSFRGMDPVRRQDMAAFLRREARLMGVEDASSWRPSDEDWKRFRDVSRDTPHAEDILWLAHAGVSTGYADGTFGGMLPVYRQDMAAFLHRLDSLK